MLNHEDETTRKSDSTIGLQESPLNHAIVFTSSESSAVAQLNSDSVPSNRIPNRFTVRFNEIFPTRALFLLLFIAVLDLITTSWLYQKGIISERNPLMRVFIERSNLLFILVKGSTIFAGWYFLSSYARTHKEFVRYACIIATSIYVGIWLIGVFAF